MHRMLLSRCTKRGFASTAVHQAKKVLVGVDGSPGSEYALEVAVRQMQPEDTLVMLHVPEALCFDALQAGPELTRRVMEVREKKVEQVMNGAKNLLGSRVKYEWVVGSSTEGARAEFVDLCNSEPAIDLLVLGAEGNNADKHLWAGSLVDYLVHHAPCSVLVARKQGSSKVKRA